MKKTKKRKKWSGVEIVSAIVLTIIAVSIIIPFWNAIVISLETESAYISQPFSWLPGEFTLYNYKHLMEKGSSLLSAYINTIKITVIGTFVGMAASVMAAYAFSRRFPGKKMLFLLMLFTMFFHGGLVPTYLLIKNMGLLDTHTPIIMLGLISVYNIIIMKNGFESVPMDLQDAAMIDGANDIRIFTSVMLPLQKPLLATFSLFTMVSYWNSWYWPMILLNSGNKSTLQLFLRSIINNANVTRQTGGQLMAMEGVELFAMGIQMASVFVVILPIMLVYPFLQKYFVKGMLVGAVKM